MTDPDLADRTYIEPITPEIVEKIIRLERPDSLLPTLGGQTGLNTAVALAERGILKKYNVQMLGADLASIKRAEDRNLFKKTILDIGLHVPKSGYVHTWRRPSGSMMSAVSRHHPALLHPRRHRRQRRLQRGGVRQVCPLGPESQSHRRNPHRGVRHRVEGIRAGGDARPQGQRRHRLLDREPRPDGHPHGRQHHRRPAQTRPTKNTRSCEMRP